MKKEGNAGRLPTCPKGGKTSPQKKLRRRDYDSHNNVLRKERGATASVLVCGGVIDNGKKKHSEASAPEGRGDMRKLIRWGADNGGESCQTAHLGPWGKKIFT